MENVYLCTNKEKLKTMQLAVQRRIKILDMLREDGHVRVNDLSKVFEVTEVTIRQDLEKMEQEGLLRRVHGGAVLLDTDRHVENLMVINRNHQKEKEAIAREAVKHIKDGDTIILDSGSTTTEIANLLVSGFQDLNVITNALNIALIIGANPSINVNVTGGEFKQPTLSLTGQRAADYFQGLHANTLFLATAGIDIDDGLTYPSMSDLPVKKAMIESANKVYLVADSSKIGHCAFATLGSISLVDTIITDKGISDENRLTLGKYKVECILAE